MASKGVEGRASQTRLGYCRRCDENTPHRKRIYSSAGRLFNRCLFDLPVRWGFGSWMCLQCGARQLIHEPPFDEESNVPVDSPQRVDLLPKLNRERDLVASVSRRERFSDKYLEAVLDRLLAGDDDLRSIRDELNLNEFDLWAMIRERFQRIEQQVEGLQAELFETRRHHSIASAAGEESEPRRSATGNRSMLRIPPVRIPR